MSSLEDMDTVAPDSTQTQAATYENSSAMDNNEVPETPTSESHMEEQGKKILQHFDCTQILYAVYIYAL